MKNQIETANSTDSSPDETAALVDEVKRLNAAVIVSHQRLAEHGLKGDLEPDVQRRMAMGLSREDAIVCAKRQALHAHVMTTITAEVKVATAEAKAAVLADCPPGTRPDKGEVKTAQEVAERGVYDAHRGELVNAAR